MQINVGMSLTSKCKQKTTQNKKRTIMRRVLQQKNGSTGNVDFEAQRHFAAFEDHSH
jgi:replicative DNA helicase